MKAPAAETVGAFLICLYFVVYYRNNQFNGGLSMKSRLMTPEDIYHFENMIYLPMVLTIFERDRLLIQKAPFKIKGPYQQLVDKALKYAQEDLRDSKLYLRQRDYKMIKTKTDDLFTYYDFFRAGYEDQRKYLNLRLRNRTEELMGMYLAKALL